MLKLRRTFSSPKVNLLDKHLSVSWPSKTTCYSYAWLRDNCNCPYCVHPSTRQKLHSSGSIVSQKPLEASWNGSLSVKWPNHASSFPENLLLQQDSPKQAVKPILWNAAQYQASRGPPIDYTDFILPHGLQESLIQLRDFGLCFLKNVPTSLLQVETVAKRFGCIRETFYGTSWDVISSPDSKNIAYTSLPLGPHMDLMYFESPPGLQFLHGLKNSVKGGESIFIDSFKAASILALEDPDAFKTLTKVPVTFQYINDGHHMHYRHCTIQTNDPNDPLKIFYAPPFQGPIQGSLEELDAFYTSFGKFEEIINRENMVHTTLLTPGDCVIFNNRRVLHGRQSFGSSGERHFRGTYVDWDDFKDSLRVHSLE